MWTNFFPLFYLLCYVQLYYILGWISSFWPLQGICFGHPYGRVVHFISAQSYMRNLLIKQPVEIMEGVRVFLAGIVIVAMHCPSPPPPMLLRGTVALPPSAPNAPEDAPAPYQIHKKYFSYLFIMTSDKIRVYMSMKYIKVFIIKNGWMRGTPLGTYPAYFCGLTPLILWTFPAYFVDFYRLFFGL